MFNQMAQTNYSFIKQGKNIAQDTLKSAPPPTPTPPPGLLSYLIFSFPVVKKGVVELNI